MRVFVTGASGWIGSAVIPELRRAGHTVVGLARSDDAAASVAASGAEVRRGSLDDLDLLAGAAAESDGVIHLAFKHDVAFSGDFDRAAGDDRRAVETMTTALAGSDRPFVLASGLLGIGQGRVTTERDEAGARGVTGPAIRHETARFVRSTAEHGVRSSVVRLPPTVHGEGDNGFTAFLTSIAREKGVSGYIGDGANRWPAANRADVAVLFREALERAPAGVVLHAAAEEGIPTKAIAEAIGASLGIDARSIAPADAAAHFGWIAMFFGMDGPASSVITRELLGWTPTHPGLIKDIEAGRYLTTPANAGA